MSLRVIVYIYADIYMHMHIYLCVCTLTLCVYILIYQETLIEPTVGLHCRLSVKDVLT